MSSARRAWADVLDKHYWAGDPVAGDLGGYYFVADDTGDLIVRPFSGQDEATPNANGVMVSNLMALYLWTGEERYRDRAEAILRAFAGAMAENVLAHAGLLAADARRRRAGAYRADRARGRRRAGIARALRDVSLPGAVVQEVRAGEAGASALPESSPAHGKTAIDGKPTAYVCIGPQCSLPVTEPQP